MPATVLLQSVVGTDCNNCTARAASAGRFEADQISFVAPSNDELPFMMSPNAEGGKKHDPRHCAAAAKIHVK